jgi:CubicO group peptidase (beta-lactamase class C family)
VFTDVWMQEAFEQGLIPSVDAAFSDVVPEFNPMNPWPTNRNITWRQLGSHTAGLARYSPCIFGRDCNLTLSEACALVDSWCAAPVSQLLCSALPLCL